MLLKCHRKQQCEFYSIKVKHKLFWSGGTMKSVDHQTICNAMHGNVQLLRYYLCVEDLMVTELNKILCG